MEIKDLSQNDQGVLVALFQKMVLADKNATEEELSHLGPLIEALGEEIYDKLSDGVDAAWGDGDQAKKYLMSVTSQEARELIYETVLEVAIEDGVDFAEAELLEWLKKSWNIEETIVEE